MEWLHPPRFHDVAQKLSASLERGLNDEAFRALLEKVGFPPLRPRSAAGSGSLSMPIGRDGRA
jgi:hypothetical protein